MSVIKRLFTIQGCSFTGVLCCIQFIDQCIFANISPLFILRMGKTCSARILQWINNLKECCNNHQGRAKGDYYIIHEGCLSTEVS